jgi:outer membrane protein, heavy metal efflux system
MRVHNWFHPFLVVSAVILTAPMVQAQSQGTSLQATVEAAWQRSPQARTLEARRAEIEAGHVAARSWIAGSPEIGLSERSDRWSERTGAREREVSLSAPVWLPGQILARKGHANASAADLEAQVANLRLTLAGEVRERVWAVAAAKENLAEALNHQRFLEATASDVQRRVNAGDLARTDGMLAQQEALAAKAAVVDAQLKVREALVQFTTLTGLPEVPAPAPEPVASAAAEPHPKLLASKTAIQTAQASLNVVNKTRNEPPTVGVALRREREGFAADSASSVTVGVQIPIGTAARNRPLEAAARTELEKASAEAAMTEATLLAEIDLARERVAASEQAFDAASSQAALARQHAQLIEKAFRLGERGLAEMLRAQNLLHEAEVAERLQRVAVGLARARLNQALGVTP